MSKLLYNLQGIARMLLPRAFYQANLSHKIKQIFKDFDDMTLQHIANRVNYYHKINTPFALPAPNLAQNILATNKSNQNPKPPLSLQTPNIDILLRNNPTSTHSTVYYYDSYQWSRYFNDNFVWAYQFGDVNYYLDTPAITKTRPLDLPKENPKILKGGGESNENSILLPLDKNRHFCFFADKIPYKDKKDKLIFRGACYQHHRNKFLQMYFNHPLCDIADTSDKKHNADFIGRKISKQKHCEYKFILSLEGNDVASNLKWAMNSNSLCIMPKPTFESWFMEGRLIAGVHYAQIDDEYSNVESTLDYYLSHEKEALDIIKNAQNFCKDFQNQRYEEACCLLVLRKYFALSGQLDISKEEREMFEI